MLGPAVRDDRRDRPSQGIADAGYRLVSTSASGAARPSTISTSTCSAAGRSTGRPDDAGSSRRRRAPGCRRARAGRSPAAGSARRPPSPASRPSRSARPRRSRRGRARRAARSPRALAGASVQLQDAKQPYPPGRVAAGSMDAPRAVYQVVLPRTSRCWLHRRLRVPAIPARRSTPGTRRRAIVGSGGPGKVAFAVDALQTIRAAGHDADPVLVLAVGVARSAVRRRSPTR